MKKILTVMIAFCFLIGLVVGCGDTTRGVADKPEKIEPVPKQGPVGAGAGAGGQKAPPPIKGPN